MELVESVYGSDKHGLVWSYLFAPGRPAVEIDTATAAQWLTQAQRDPTDSFLWLHFSLSNTASERWMRSYLDLPDAFYDALHEKAAVSTRLEQEGSALVAVMHDVLFGSSFEAANVSSVTLCLESRILVSARLHPLRSVDRLRATVKEAYVFRSSAELLAQLLRDQAGVLADIVRQSAGHIDAIEDKLLASQVSTSRRELGALRRALVRLQRLLAPEPAALFRLLNRPPLWIGNEDLQDLRQAAEEFSTAVDDAAALGERVKLLQEEFGALINERTGRTLFVLTMVTVLALPINLVAGLFGMNVGGVPLSEHRHGFVLIVLVLAVVTGVLAYVALGKRND